MRWEGEKPLSNEDSVGKGLRGGGHMCRKLLAHKTAKCHPNRSTGLWNNGSYSRYLTSKELGN